jgi:hypothetical protein
MVHLWWGGLGVGCSYDSLWSDEGITLTSDTVAGVAYAVLYEIQRILTILRFFSNFLLTNDKIPFIIE